MQGKVRRTGIPQLPEQATPMQHPRRNIKQPSIRAGFVSLRQDPLYAR
jgi:hypothetical protein